MLRPVVTSWQPPTELRWRGTILARRLFNGEHGFRLEQLSNSRVRFYQEETFRGLLVPFYSRLRLRGTRDGFERANQALRERAESVSEIE